MSENAEEEIFYGEHRYQIDEKMRIRIPAKFKDLLGDKPCFICGPGKKILLYHPAAAKRVFDELFGGIRPANNAKNKARSIIGSNTFMIQEDKQGRFVLPAKLIKHAAIDRNAVVVGAVHHVEIWSEENWDAVNDMSSEDYDALFDALDDGMKDTKIPQQN